MLLFVENEKLAYTSSPGAQEIPVVHCNDRALLVRQCGEALVRNGLRALGIPLDATMNAPFEPRLHACGLVLEAWKISDMILPSNNDERYLLNQ